MKSTFWTNIVLNEKVHVLVFLSIIELKNARWNIERGFPLLSTFLSDLDKIPGAVHENLLSDREIRDSRLSESHAWLLG
jgi:hypothetical protein